MERIYNYNSLYFYDTCCTYLDFVESLYNSQLAKGSMLIQLWTLHGIQGTQKRKLLPVEYGTVYLQRLTIETGGGNPKMLTEGTFVGAVQK